MERKISFSRILTTVVCGLCFTTNGALAATLDMETATTLMQQGKPVEAYSLLEPFESEQAGNVQYDYLLGIAALDSGKPDKATLVFERVLAVDPNHAGARLDMARAYFQLGDYTRAKSEFETVLSQNPPQVAKTTIQKYLAAIEEREAAKRTVMRGYVEGTVGHDSNVNSSTGQSQISVPALGDLIFTLNPTNVKTSDNYLSLGAGGEISHKLKPNFLVYAGADVKDRVNNNENRFDFVSVDGRIGVGLGEDGNQLKVGLLGGRYYLDKHLNRDTSGINAEWRYNLNTSNQLNLFGQHVLYRFEPTTSVENFDQDTVGAGILHVLAEGKAVLFGSVYLGDERDTERADGAKGFHGLRVGGQTILTDKTDLFASVGAQFGKFDQENLAFLTTREDDQYDFSTGINWHYDTNWTVRPQLTYTKNDSNIDLRSYNRTDISLTLRRDF